jgi:hypothetical protein
MFKEIKTFEVYLLSTMRADDVVAEIVRKYNLSIIDLENAKQIVYGMGFGQPELHHLELYKRLIGNPLYAEHLLTEDSATPIAYQNSTRVSFPLTLWPAFEFVINVATDGSAWNARFSRAKNHIMPRLENVACLKPWCFTKKEVTKHFGKLGFEDGWSNWEDLSYVELDLLNKPRKYCFQFDFGLLQNIFVID